MQFFLVEDNECFDPALEKNKERAVMEVSDWNYFFAGNGTELLEKCDFNILLYKNDLITCVRLSVYILLDLTKPQQLA